MMKRLVFLPEQISANVTIPTFTPIRAFRGYARSFQIQENTSGKTWVLKPDDGKHLPANEIIGRHIYSRMGLPVPEQKSLVMTELRSGTKSIQMANRPASTGPELQLLIRYLPDQLRQLVFEVVPPAFGAKVSNVEDFLGAFLIDICIENVDVRQALFVPEGENLRAVFIDHSHIFGGPSELTSRRVRCKRSFSRLVLQAAGESAAVSRWKNLIHERLCEYFLEAYSLVPRQWQRRDLCLMLDRINTKIDYVKQFVELDLERIRLQESRETVQGCSSDPWLGL